MSVLVPSLPGSASRMPVESLSLAKLRERMLNRSATEPGKLDIKRREPGILFVSLQYLLLQL